MKPTKTALIVAVPEAEEAVGPFRAMFDRAATWGVPAHVSVIYPFLPPERINLKLIARLDRILKTVPCFDVSFTHIEWFGNRVVWLAPQPSEPFRHLTHTVWWRFPEAPPYAGVHTDVVPHLTIGHNVPRPVLEHAAEVVSRQLPIHARVNQVALMAGCPEPDTWHTLWEFRLGPQPPAPRDPSGSEVT